MPPDTQGVWLGVVQAPGDSRDIGDNIGTYALHATLLRNGRVLMWSGLTEGSGYLYKSWAWDPAEPIANAIGRWFIPDFDPDLGGPLASPPHAEPGWDDDHQIDMFCSHHAVLEAGRVLGIGGAGQTSEQSSTGNAALHIYDTGANRWSKLPTSMAAQRWYPTGVTMPDGRVLVFSGNSTSEIAQSVEIVGRDLVPRVVSGGDRRIYIFPG